MNGTHSTAGASRGAAGARIRPLRAAPYLLVGTLLACWAPAATRPEPSPRPDHPQAEVPASRALAPGPRAVVRHEPVFAPLAEEEAWAYLPARVRGAVGPLPAWARILARPLPRTTAAMLELDFAHRAAGPLDPKTRARIRWAAARALRCDYGEAYALADLRAAGADEDEIRALTSDPDRLSDETQRLLAFVRRLSKAGYSVTDGEVAALIARSGAKQVVAVVLCVAYANFMDRLALALGLAVEPGGAVRPLDVRFERRAFGSGVVPPRALPAEPESSEIGGLKDPDWRPDDLSDVRTGLETQKARRPRISLPETDPPTNRWGLVGRTYQPALATAWTSCTQAFAEEADQDPVFEQSVFWIVTRTKQCFY